MTTTSRSRLTFDHEDRVARLVLAAPKANILDRQMMRELADLAGELAAHRSLRAVVLTAEGPNFSYGASIEEHLPGKIDGVLADLDGLLRRLLEIRAPTIAAIRGQCLGGGLEIALACDLIVASESAMFGLPEIKLAAFAPAASALLPLRVAGAAASELLMTGASWSAPRALEVGLINRVVADQLLEEELDAWILRDFLPRSVHALEQAARAARRAVCRAVEEDLPALVRQYTGELMATADAEEGIRAFLEKRQARWSA